MANLINKKKRKTPPSKFALNSPSTLGRLCGTQSLCLLSVGARKRKCIYINGCGSEHLIPFQFSMLFQLIFSSILGPYVE